MTIVSAKDFRGATGQYFERAAQGEDVIVKTRDHGAFKIVPVTDDDTLMSKSTFLKKLRDAEQEIAEGRGMSFKTAEDAVEYFRSL